MDLLSSIRKEGSRGGVNFSWSDVTTSQHRENYLGHSLMAPVGRWQKGKDLTWYAKGGSKSHDHDETKEQKLAREREEEIRRIKDAEEDALAKALGLPVKERNTTGSNSITLVEVNQAVRELGVGEDNEVNTGNTFANFTFQNPQDSLKAVDDFERKYVVKTNEMKCRSRSPRRERKNRRHRHSLRSPEKRRRRSTSRGEYRRHHGQDEIEDRGRSFGRSRRRRRSTSLDRHKENLVEESRRKSRRSRSPDVRSRHYRKLNDAHA